MRKLLYLAILLCGIQAFGTISLTQVKSNNACSGATCAVTVTSTGAGHGLIYGFINSTNSATAITAVTSGACAVAWVHCSNCAITSTGGALDLSYCTQSNSGVTSITATVSGSIGTGVGVVWEFSTTGTGFAIDSGATPSGTKSDTTCTACAGVALTLSGSNVFVAVLGTGTGTISNLTGTGFTDDLANPNGDGVGHGLISASATAPTSWTMTSGTLVASALAIKETTGGVTCNLSISLMGVGCR